MSVFYAYLTKKAFYPPKSEKITAKNRLILVMKQHYFTLCH